MRYIWVKSGPAKVLREDKGRLLVQVAGRLKPSWISKTHVKKAPKSATFSKTTHFTQDCGCTAVVELSPKRLTSYNVYGNTKKYLKSNTKKGSTDTPYKRRVKLAEEGYTRARSKSARPITDNAKEAYRLLVRKVKGRDGEPRTYNKVAYVW